MITIDQLFEEDFEPAWMLRARQAAAHAEAEKCKVHRVYTTVRRIPKQKRSADTTPHKRRRINLRDVSLPYSGSGRPITPSIPVPPNEFPRW